MILTVRSHLYQRPRSSREAQRSHRTSGYPTRVSGFSNLYRSRRSYQRMGVTIMRIVVFSRKHNPTLIPPYTCLLIDG
ncbi:hypothetical protein F511_46592 [Dorcoceras hygrometricum]|uniref:Uncharacterized protein n=1 Tax=Dorcoceras hygrometricum TaxID=472368 RepID=A0A2Z6ZZZ5_9LAMI|nr:hypothetical protein F511_46592 [Dorcoceras hygrometricum]